MQDALVKDKRLHRDLSVGNIILVKEPDVATGCRRGYLIDWDASIRVDGSGEAVREGRAVSRAISVNDADISKGMCVGYLVVHVHPNALLQSCGVQTHLQGRHGVVAICRPILRLALSTS